MRRHAIFLLGLALLTAGCTGKEGSQSMLETASDLVTDEPTPEQLARLPGSIEGVVLTPALSPIDAAVVTLVRENVSTTTDAGGFFRFANLATTSFLIQARAEGYETRTVLAAARNGTVIEMNITLQPLVIVPPYAETRELAGFLSCGVRVATPEGEQGADCATADPNHRDLFEFELSPDGKSVHLELVWDVAQNPGVKRLNLHVETVGYGANDLDLGNATGEGYVRIDVPREVMEKYYPEGGAMRATVAMAPDATTPAAAAQTPFTVYVTTFYVEPGPDGYSVLAG